ncbi:hypothetical protein CRG98_016507 [Punica granatum]|uniref:Uncharacterized protein n=1 Tax=Punica granatum TaxID=22663 RepID=A0A2I0K3H6_PUNGR|nr:hypothetical protein CRG98_016507 [Punica granatum]
MDLGRWFEFGPLWSPLGCKHKQNHNVKSGQGAMRWPKLKAVKVSPWATLRRAVMEMRAQKMLSRTQVQKQLEECIEGSSYQTCWGKQACGREFSRIGKESGSCQVPIEAQRSVLREEGQDWVQEEFRRLPLAKEKQGKDKRKEISEKYVISKAPTQVASHPEEYSKGKSGSGLDEKDKKPMLVEPASEELELANCDDSTLEGTAAFPNPNTSELSQPLTLFPSLLACKDKKFLEDEVLEVLNPIILTDFSIASNVNGDNWMFLYPPGGCRAIGIGRTSVNSSKLLMCWRLYSSKTG